MSNMDYINDLFKALDFPESFSHSFIPVPYEGSNSCLRNGIDRYGRSSRFMRLRSIDRDLFVCPRCGAVDHHESKGIRKISLTHISCHHQRLILEIEYRRYFCHHCKHYFRNDIPVRFKDTRMTTTAVQACLAQFRENTAMAVISRMMGISKSSVYRIFFHHVSVPERFYLLRPVISVDEFRATTDKGTYAFHITDPVSGETIDIIEDRKASILRNYFTRCPLKEKNRVRIIIMDLSNPFRSIMHNLFPHATIIADRFHYVRVFGDGLRRSRIDT